MAVILLDGLKPTQKLSSMALFGQEFPGALKSLARVKQIEKRNEAVKGSSEIETGV